MLKVFDEVKTKELLAEVGKSEEGIFVFDGTNIPSLLQKSVVEVRLTTGKGQFKTLLSTKEMGVKNVNDETKEFLANYVDAGTVNFFPKSLEKDITNVQVKIRRQLERNALATGINGFYLTKDTYRSIKAEFIKAKEEFLVKRDYILDEHETLKKHFKNRLNKAFIDLGTENKDMVVQSFLAKFPTPDEIRKNFYMELIITPYPVLGEMPDLAEMEEEDREIFAEAVEGHEFNAVSVFYNMVGTVLNNLFDRVSATSQSLSDDASIPSKTKGGINSTIKTATNDNDILKNTKISTFIKAIKKIYIDGVSLKSDESEERIERSEILEISEFLLGQIYSYAKYLGVEEQVKITGSGYEVDDLLAIGEHSPDISLLL